MRDKNHILNPRSIRLKGYNYSQAGAYFVTICAHRRECLLGKVVHGEMHLSEAGMMVQSIWEKLPQRFFHTDIDVFRIMPNHFHGIIMIDVGAIHESPLRLTMVIQSRRKMLLSKMVGYFKMNSAKEINQLRCTPANPSGKGIITNMSSATKSTWKKPGNT